MLLLRLELTICMRFKRIVRYHLQIQMYFCSHSTGINQHKIEIEQIQGAYTRSPRMRKQVMSGGERGKKRNHVPRYVRSLLSKTFFNLPPMSRTRFLHSFKPGQLPAAVQHSEHAFEAALTVSSSSSFLVWRTTTRSTKRQKPTDQVDMPRSGFVVVSVTRKEEANWIQRRRTFWSMVSDFGEVRDKILMTNAPKSVAGSWEKIYKSWDKAILLRGLTASISSGRCASISEAIAVGCLGIIGHLY